MNRNKYATQARCRIAALKRKPHSYLEMLSYGISTSPWKRVQEGLRDDEAIVKRKGKDGLIRWKVIAATRWTA